MKSSNPVRSKVQKAESEGGVKKSETKIKKKSSILDTIEPIVPLKSTSTKLSTSNIINTDSRNTKPTIKMEAILSSASTSLDGTGQRQESSGKFRSSYIPAVGDVIRTSNTDKKMEPFNLSHVKIEDNFGNVGDNVETSFGLGLLDDMFQEDEDKGTSNIHYPVNATPNYTEKRLVRNNRLCLCMILTVDIIMCYYFHAFFCQQLQYFF